MEKTTRRIIFPPGQRSKAIEQFLFLSLQRKEALSQLLYSNLSSMVQIQSGRGGIGSVERRLRRTSPRI